MHVRGVRLAAALLTVAGILASCSLTSLLYPPIDYTDPAYTFQPIPSLMFLFGSGGVPTVLHHGTATITITSGEPRVVQLPHLASDEPSLVFPGFGSNVAWRGGDWVLYVSGDGAASDPLTTADLTLRREDTDPPLQADGSDCTITFTSTTTTHVAGHAECTGLAWEDPMSDPMDLPAPSGSPAVAHPAFDATIVFDATP